MERRIGAQAKAQACLRIDQRDGRALRRTGRTGAAPSLVRRSIDSESTSPSLMSLPRYEAPSPSKSASIWFLAVAVKLRRVLPAGLRSGNAGPETWRLEIRRVRGQKIADDIQVLLRDLSVFAERSCIVDQFAPRNSSAASDEGKSLLSPHCSSSAGAPRCPAPADPAAGGRLGRGQRQLRGPQ